VFVFSQGDTYLNISLILSLFELVLGCLTATIFQIVKKKRCCPV